MLEFNDNYSDVDDSVEVDTDDEELPWKVQVHDLALTLCESPIEGVPLEDELAALTGVRYAPLGDPDARTLRNLFSESAFREAEERAKSSDSTVRYMAGLFLFHRQEAMGRYCFNTNCLRLLPYEAPRSGHPRFYCVGCKDAGQKRNRRNRAKPTRPERLKPMTVPGIPFQTRTRGTSSAPGFKPPITDEQPPWVEQTEPRNDNPEDLATHFRRWVARHKKLEAPRLPQNLNL